METLFSKKFEKPLDKPQKVWYNPSVVRKRDRGVKKKFEKPLDKSPNPCYNKITKRVATETPKKKGEKNDYP